MKEGDRCSGGLFSFLNERDADTGGMVFSPVFDVNGDGSVDADDIKQIAIDQNGDGTNESIDANITDVGFKGHLYNPVILRDDGPSNNEKKYFSSSTETIETVNEKAETRGIYYWKQVE